jgi:intein/homing endonuclease
MKLFLGNNSDIHHVEENDIIHLTPTNKAIGKIKDRKDKEAWDVDVWHGFDHHKKYFYYRKKRKASKIDGDEFDTKEAAYIAAEDYLHKHNTNHVLTVISLKAKDITEQIAEKFYYLPCKNIYDTLNVPIDPYFLGLWLGDGSSRTSSICSIDEEIIDYVHQYAKHLGLSVTNVEKRPNHAGTYKIGHGHGESNALQKKFRDMELLSNKHIPQIYRENDEDVRRKLLAGIIDTDGFLDKNVYSIIQKNVVLAKQICDVAKSLGYYATIREKMARATNGKNLDKHKYQNVLIYMNPHNPPLPTRLPRKSWEVNRDTPNHGIIVKLNNANTSFRHEWTPELLSMLQNMVVKYTDSFGRIQWKNIVREEEAFKEWKPDALRATYNTKIKKCVTSK